MKISALCRRFKNLFYKKDIISDFNEEDYFSFEDENFYDVDQEEDSDYFNTFVNYDSYDKNETYLYGPYYFRFHVLKKKINIFV